MISKNKIIQLVSKIDKTRINIVISFICKIGSSFIGFLIIPVLINDIGKVDYGLYLTITSFCLLTQILDFGINNTIKNKISGYLVNKEYDEASKYYTNCYVFVGFIFLLTFLVLTAILLIRTEWIATIFSMKEISSTWFYCILLIIGFSLLNFLSLPGINLFYCIDKTYYVFVVTFFSQLIGFVVYYSFRNIVPNRMILLCTALYGFPFFVNLISVIALQLNKGVLVKFKLNSIDLLFLLSILKKSISFFFIQIASIVQFQVGNFLISTHFPPVKVTEYNSYNKYFSIVQILLSVIITPYWISFAKFKGKNDIIGLRNEFKKLNILTLGLMAIIIVQYFLGSFVFKIWLKDNIAYNYTTALYFLLYYILYFIGVNFVIMVNAVLNVKWQMYTSFISVILFLSLFNITSPIFGISGIVISLMVANFYGVTVAPFQVYRFFKSHKII